MEFPTIGHLKHILKEIFIKEYRDFEYVFNDRTKLRDRCKSKECKWVVYARVKNSDNKNVMINTLIDNHDCGIVFDIKRVTSIWLSRHFMEQFRLNPNMNYQSFREMVCAQKFSNVSKIKFYIAKDKASKTLEGSVKDQYTI